MPFARSITEIAELSSLENTLHVRFHDAPISSMALTAAQRFCWVSWVTSGLAAAMLSWTTLDSAAASADANSNAAACQRSTVLRAVPIAAGTTRVSVT